MRWIRFSQQGRAAYGVLEGERIREVAGGPLQGYEMTSRIHDLSAVKVEVPLVPSTFYCVGLNYAEHIRQVAVKLGVPPDLPKQPDVGYRAVNALIADGEPVVIPADAQKVQYEGELAVVIGKRAKDLDQAEALSCVLGYTIGNDVSERIWQKSDRTMWRAKNTDTFKPMGPWIETNVRLEDLVTRIRLNGEQMIEFPTNHMIFGVVDYLVAMTTCLTLYPGDVVWMGTEGATANMKHGDRVEIEISGIGKLINPVIREGR